MRGAEMTERIMGNPISIADLERLEADIEEALIDLIDKPAHDPMIADLQRRKAHLLEEIARLRQELLQNGKPITLH